jgi:hypothetical protein
MEFVAPKSSAPIVSRLLPFAFLLVACAASPRVERGALAVSAASIACDWGQTRSMASAGWGSYREDNHVLGPHPTVGAVDAYFTVYLATHLLAGVLLPRRLRLPAAGLVLAQQVPAVAGNASLPIAGPGCGL